MGNEAELRRNLALLILRLALAAVFIYHGAEKIGFLHGDLDNRYWGADWYKTMKPVQGRDEPVPGPLETSGMQFAVAWGELLGGVAMLLGALTRVAAVGLVLIQGGAIWFVTGGRGFANYEFNITLVAVCLCLLLVGGGRWSVDHCYLQWRREKRAATGRGAPASQPGVPAGV